MLFQPPALAHAPIHTQPTTHPPTHTPLLESTRLTHRWTPTHHSKLMSLRWRDMKTEGPSVLAFHLRDIHLCLPSVPSVRAIRLGDIPLGLPYRGHPSNQVSQI